MSAKTIEQVAREDALEAIKQGATAPWGDGETVTDTRDLAHQLGLEALTREQISEYDQAFRSTIDAEAPRAQ